MILVIRTAVRTEGAHSNFRLVQKPLLVRSHLDHKLANDSIDRGEVCMHGMDRVEG